MWLLGGQGLVLGSAWPLPFNSMRLHRHAREAHLFPVLRQLRVLLGLHNVPCLVVVQLLRTAHSQHIRPAGGLALLELLNQDARTAGCRA